MFTTCIKQFRQVHYHRISPALSPGRWMNFDVVCNALLQEEKQFIICFSPMAKLQSTLACQQPIDACQIAICISGTNKHGEEHGKLGYIDGNLGHGYARLEDPRNRVQILLIHQLQRRACFEAITVDRKKVSVQKSLVGTRRYLRQENDA